MGGVKSRRPTTHWLATLKESKKRRRGTRESGDSKRRNHVGNAAGAHVLRRKAAIDIVGALAEGNRNLRAARLALVVQASKHIDHISVAGMLGIDAAIIDAPADEAAIVGDLLTFDAVRSGIYDIDVERALGVERSPARGLQARHIMASALGEVVMAATNVGNKHIRGGGTIVGVEPCEISQKTAATKERISYSCW